MSSSGAAYVNAGPPTTTNNVQLLDPADGSTELHFYRAAGATNLGIYGSAADPAIATLYGPDGIKYADYTFDGNNAELDVSTGNLSLRPLAGGDVNVWALTGGNPKLRVGNMGFTESLDLSHDGANAHIIATIGSVKIADALSVGPTGLIDYTGPSATSATAGAQGAPPATVQGYIVLTIGGVGVRVPYYLP